MLVELTCMISEQSPVKIRDAFDLVYLFLVKQRVLVDEHL